MADSVVAGSLAVSGQSSPAVLGKAVDLALSGTWVGTVKLQVFTQNTWVDTGDSWTANTFKIIDAATPQQWRIDFARTSGTLVYDLRGETR